MHIYSVLFVCWQFSQAKTIHKLNRVTWITSSIKSSGILISFLEYNQIWVTSTVQRVIRLILSFFVVIGFIFDWSFVHLKFEFPRYEITSQVSTEARNGKFLLMNTLLLFDNRGLGMGKKNCITVTNLKYSKPSNIYSNHLPWPWH